MTCRTLLATGLVLATIPALAQDAGEAAAPGAPARVQVEAPSARITVEDGYPSLRLGPVRLDLHGRLQTDWRRSEGRLGEERDVDFSRRRVTLEGEIGPRVTFELDAELGDDDQPWRDARLDYRFANALRIRGGQFKIPFSLEATTSSGNLDFPFRSQAAAQLAPERGRGVMAHGRAWRRRLMYEVGVFGPSEHRDPADLRVSDEATAAMRLASVPFARTNTVLEDLEVGVTATIGRLDEGISDLRGRTALGEPLFERGYWVRGLRRRTGLEARWEPGPVSVAAEYLRVSDERRGQSLSGTDLPALVAHGWYLSGTWLLTGEDKAGSLRPTRLVRKGGPGAIEAAVRVESLEFGDADLVAPGFLNPRADEIPGSRNRVLTAGVNWYPDRWIKVQAHVIREVIRGTPPIDGGRSTILSQVLRLQLML
jgi:phosphate-selective porin OprO/OprP